MARESPRIVPVAMPGDRRRQRLPPGRLPHGGAEGQGALTDLPGHGADRLAGRDDDDREDQQGEGQGAAEHDAGVLEAHQRHEGDRQQAVDDGGDRREVLQVHLDEAVPPLGRVGELLQVDRRRDAQRDRHERGEHHQPQAAEDAGAEPGRLGAHDRGVVGEQLAVEPVGTLDGRVDDQRQQDHDPEEHGEPEGDQEDQGHRRLVPAASGGHAAGDLAGRRGCDAHQ